MIRAHRLGHIPVDPPPFDPRTVGNHTGSVGPACGNCQTVEAVCARDGWQCCRACDHRFTGARKSRAA